MLKVRAGDNIILGLESENIKRLKDGRPIKVKGTELDVKQDIFIVYGETAEDIAESLNIPTVQ